MTGGAPLETLERIGFGPFELDVERRELYRGAERVTVQKLPFRALTVLVERAGEIVTREELRAALWPDGTIVDFDHGLNTAMKKLRHALGDSVDRPRFVETIAQRGYRWLAPVKRRPTASAASILARHRLDRPPTPRLHRAPLVGRDVELARIDRALARVVRGRGGVVVLTGEAGIGKTRLLDEIAVRARRTGLRVLTGRCTQGDWGRAYGPFAEALAQVVDEDPATALREIFGEHAPVLTTLVAALPGRLPGLRAPSPLRPDEERERLLDATSQVLRALARRAPVVLLIDDLHWADAGTLAMLAHLVRFASDAPIVVLAGYRNADVDREHPLSRLERVLLESPGFEAIQLEGLDARALSSLVSDVLGGDPPPGLVTALHRTTGGNPFFARELLLHLDRTGRLERVRGGGAGELDLQGIDLPTSVRDVIERHLARLSDPARALLGAASGFHGLFRLDAAAAAADLAPSVGLAALDETIDEGLVRPTQEPDRYDFTHALCRHAIYTGLTSSRQLRLHRRLALELACAGGDESDEAAGEIARHFHRSAALPGAEAGVPACLAAASRAEASAALEEAAQFLRMTLDLLPEGDPQHARVLARYGLALAWSGAFDEAVPTATRAADALAAGEGAAAAADYLADVADAVWLSAYDPRAWLLTARGLHHAGASRGWTWVRLASHQLLASEAMNPEMPALPTATPLRREVFQRLLAHRDRVPRNRASELWRCACFESRAEAIRLAGDEPIVLVYWIGDYRKGLARYREFSEEVVARGEIAAAAAFLGSTTLPACALGELDAAEEALARAREWSARGERSPMIEGALHAQAVECARVRGVGIAEALVGYEAYSAQGALGRSFVGLQFNASLAVPLALMGRRDDALRALDLALPAIEKGPGWAANYSATAALYTEALWELGERAHVETIERALREKVVGPDFRFPNIDGRLSLARVCALTERWDEAREWFAKARAVLDEQGARPLRAIVDFDEARMHARRDAGGDRAHARRLLDAAVRQFEAIGMPGWVRRAEDLARELG